MSSDLEVRIATWFAEQPEFSDFELEGLKIRQHGQRSFVEILLDRKDGRITMDECGRWNRRLSDHLENTGCFEGPYLVEISSPGVDRLMTEPKHFKRALGRRVKVHYRDSADTAREFIGRLDSADESSAVLRAEQNELMVPYDRILQARQEFTFLKEKR